MDENLNKVKLTADHVHEACDRAFMLSSMFDEFLLQHPAVMGIPELKEKAGAISDALGDFYQVSGQAMADFDEQSNIEVDVKALFGKKVNTITSKAKALLLIVEEPFYMPIYQILLILCNSYIMPEIC